MREGNRKLLSERWMVDFMRVCHCLTTHVPPNLSHGVLVMELRRGVGGGGKDRRLRRKRGKRGKGIE